MSCQVASHWFRISCHEPNSPHIETEIMEFAGCLGTGYLDYDRFSLMRRASSFILNDWYMRHVQSTIQVISQG